MRSMSLSRLFSCFSQPRIADDKQLLNAYTPERSTTRKQEDVTPGRQGCALSFGPDRASKERARILRGSLATEPCCYRGFAPSQLK